MYEGELFCGGEIEDLGSDTLRRGADRRGARLARRDARTPYGLGPKREWKKVRSAGKLWRYDKKEFAVWKEAL